MSKDSKTIADKPQGLTKLPWGAVTSICLVIITFFLSGAAGALYTWIYATEINHWSADQTSQWLNNSVYGQFFYSIVVYGIWLVLIALFILAYSYLKKNNASLIKKWRSILNVIGWKKPKWRDIPYALSGFAIYFVSYVIVIAIISKVFPSFNPNQQQDVGFQGNIHGASLILVFASLVVLPPFVEETVFRGFLFTGLKKSIPVVWAGIIVSLVFAAPHLFEGQGGQLLVVGGVDTFVLSLVLVYLRQQTGTLWSSVGLHMLKNGVAFASLFFFAHVIL